MKIQHIDDQKPCKKILKISLSGDELKSAHKGVLTSFQSRSQIPGFRLGKAPLKLVETKFSQEIKTDVLKQLLPKACKEALESEKIRAVSDPIVDQIDYNLENGINFQATVDVFPKVEVPSYKKLKLGKDSAAVEESEVEKVIEQLREQHAVFHPITDRNLNYNDYALIDYQSFDDKGKKSEQKNVSVLVKEKEEEGFSDQLIGMKPDETREVTLETTKDHPKLKFKIKLNAIKEKKIPELDEEFLKTLGDAKSFEELRGKIREDLKLHKEKTAQEVLRGRAIQTVSDKVDFDVPESQVHQEMEKIYAELIQRARQGLVSPKSLDDEKVKQDIEAEARRRVRIAYVMHGISEKEGLKISEEELNQEMGRIAERLGKTLEELRHDLKKAERLESLRSRMMQDKVIDLILQNAIIS